MVKWSQKAAEFTMLIPELQIWILLFLYFNLLKLQVFYSIWPTKESYLFTSPYIIKYQHCHLSQVCLKSSTHVPPRISRSPLFYMTWYFPKENPKTRILIWHLRSGTVSHFNSANGGIFKHCCLNHSRKQFSIMDYEDDEGWEDELVWSLSLPEAGWLKKQKFNTHSSGGW